MHERWTGFFSWCSAEELVAALPEEPLRRLDGDFAGWAHCGQLPPPGEWRVWALIAGRGFGKTRAGAEWVRSIAEDPAARIALVGATIGEVRSVMVEGASGVLAVDPDAVWRPGLGVVRFASGAEARLFSGASAEALRGPQHSHAWCDELAKWSQGQACWDNLMLGMRVGAGPRVLVTTTPRASPLLTLILGAKDTLVTGGATKANPYLPAAFIEAAYAHYGESTLAAQELDGTMPEGRAGQLFPPWLIARCRVDPDGPLAALSLHRPEPFPQPALKQMRPVFQKPERAFERIKVGIDPPVGGGPCGIIVAGIDAEGRVHVMEDASVTNAAPEVWAKAATDAAARWGGAGANVQLVAEANQGGAMVRFTLRAADPTARVRLVRASQGKAVRAEPVAALAGAGRLRLWGRMSALEEELGRLDAGGGVVGASPDRADAMVWAVSALIEGVGVTPRVSVF